MKKISIALSILVVAAAVIPAGCQATRAGYESAPYKSAGSDGRFELRDYPALTVVEYGVWPLHQVVFAGILRGLTQAAEKNA